MAQAIKVRYLNGRGNASANSYTFLSNEAVCVGQEVVIRMHQSGEPQMGLVTEINVDESEVLKWGGAIKTIAGAAL